MSAEQAAQIQRAGVDRVAQRLGLDPNEVGQWVAHGQVPEEHRERLAQLGIRGDADTSQEPSGAGGDSDAGHGEQQATHQGEEQQRSGGASGQQRKSSGRRKSGGSRRSGGRRSALGKEAQTATQATAWLAHTDDAGLDALQRITKSEHGRDTADDLAALAEAVMTLPSQTVDALKAVGEVAEETNPAKVAVRLSRHDRRGLSEIGRVVAALGSEDEPDLPSKPEDAAVEVAEQVAESLQQDDGRAEVVEWLLRVQQQ